MLFGLTYYFNVHKIREEISLKRKLSILLSIFIFLQFFSFTGAKVQAAGITLKSIALDKRTILPGESVNVTVDFSIPTASLKQQYSVYLNYIDSNGFMRYDMAEYKNGVFALKIQTSSMENKKTYDLYQLSIIYGDSAAIYKNKDLNLDFAYNTISTPLDFSNYSFEVQGTSKTGPIIKGISFSQAEYYSNEAAKAILEVEGKEQFAETASIAFENIEKKIYTDFFALSKVKEVYEDGVYKAVYEGNCKPDTGIDWTGTWIPNRVNIVSKGLSVSKYHSTTVNRPYIMDFSSSSFKVVPGEAPGLKLLSSSIDDGAINVPLIYKLELYFDKKLQSRNAAPDNKITLKDAAGNIIPISRENYNNTAILRFGAELKNNNKYTLSIEPNTIIAHDGSPMDNIIDNFTFTTVPVNFAAYGDNKYVTENTEFVGNYQIKGNLIVAPGKNIWINKDAMLDVTGNVIVYGNLVNEGTLKVGGNIFINEEKEETSEAVALQNGDYLNKGVLSSGNLVAKSYPKPILNTTPGVSGDIAVNKAEVTIHTYPFMNYSVNGKEGTIDYTGRQKETVNLQYGSNQIVFKAEDPFGNSQEKTIILNNVSTPVKIIAAYPQNNYIKVPVNSPIYLKLERNVITGPGASKVTMTDGNGVKVPMMIDIRGSEVFYYKPDHSLSYSKTYKIYVPKDALMDSQGNFLEQDFTATFTTGKEVTVLGGNDRYNTSLQISKEGWVKSDYAVLATGSNFPDALSAGPLAAKYGAPILLVKSKTLDEELELELDRLSVKNIFIIGGTGVVSQNIEDTLKAKGISVIRLKGNNRYETSVAIARQMNVNENTTAFLVTGENFPDALSVASIAAANQMPIILTERTRLPEVTKKFFAEKKLSKFYIIGGHGAIAPSLEGLNPTWVRRISGNNRYETNLNILVEFQENIDFTYTFFATGENFPDALSGSALAGLSASPVVLVKSGMPQNVVDSFREARGYMKMKYLLGGEKVVHRTIVDKITK